MFKNIIDADAGDRVTKRFKVAGAEPQYYYYDQEARTTEIRSTTAAQERFAWDSVGMKRSQNAEYYTWDGANRQSVHDENGDAITVAAYGPQIAPGIGGLEYTLDATGAPDSLEPVHLEDQVGTGGLVLADDESTLQDYNFENPSLSSFGEMEIGSILDGKRVLSEKEFLNPSTLISERKVNLYDFGARLYDPSLGRFLIADPLLTGIGLSGLRMNPFQAVRFAAFARSLGAGMKTFQYASSNPANRFDPLGLNDLIDAKIEAIQERLEGYREELDAYTNPGNPLYQEYLRHPPEGSRSMAMDFLRNQIRQLEAELSHFISVKINDTEVVIELTDEELQLYEQLYRFISGNEEALGMLREPFEERARQLGFSSLDEAFRASENDPDLRRRLTEGFDLRGLAFGSVYRERLLQEIENYRRQLREILYEALRRQGPGPNYRSRGISTTGISLEFNAIGRVELVSGGYTCDCVGGWEQHGYYRGEVEAFSTTIGVSLGFEWGYSAGECPTYGAREKGTIFGVGVGAGQAISLDYEFAVQVSDKTLREAQEMQGTSGGLPLWLQRVLYLWQNSTVSQSVSGEGGFDIPLGPLGIVGLDIVPIGRYEITFVPTRTDPCCANAEDIVLPE
ncbi:MAG: hypothetical protein NUW37_17500 [Planctomycetes bacterium]|nr:hypothetical protein [Planctomycetota bacterium]